MENKSSYQAIIDSPIGKLGICTSEDYLVGIDFLTKNTNLIPPKTKTAKQVISQLKIYFKDANFQFDLPIKLDVSEFQNNVLGEMQQIPVGNTRCYGDLAKNLKTIPRAIGNACRRNPIPIIIPCHRVVGKYNMGGFSGQTSGPKMKIKQWLLQHEIGN